MDPAAIASLMILTKLSIEVLTLAQSHSPLLIGGRSFRFPALSESMNRPINVSTVLRTSAQLPAVYDPGCVGSVLVMLVTLPAPPSSPIPCSIISNKVLIADAIP